MIKNPHRDPNNSHRWSKIATATAEIDRWSLEIPRTPVLTETGTVQLLTTRTATPRGKPLRPLGKLPSPPAPPLVRPRCHPRSWCREPPSFRTRGSMRSTNLDTSAGQAAAGMLAFRQKDPPPSSLHWKSERDSQIHRVFSAQMERCGPARRRRKARDACLHFLTMDG